jgi:hypothetical protein
MQFADCFCVEYKVLPAVVAWIEPEGYGNVASVCYITREDGTRFCKPMEDG